MILCVGSWPSRNAGKATDDMIDFSDLGGMLMISRVISPRRTRSSCQPIACKCQPGSKAWPGASVANAFSTKALKFRRSSARNNRASEFIPGVPIRVRVHCGRRRGVQIRQVAAQDRDVLDCYRFPFCAGLGALSVALSQLQQQAQRAAVAAGRLAGGPQQDRFQPRYASRAPVFGNGHLLPDDLANDVGERFDARRPSAGITALAGSKSAMLRGPAISYAVVRVRPGRVASYRKIGLRQRGASGWIVIVVHSLLSDSNWPNSNTTRRSALRY